MGNRLAKESQNKSDSEGRQNKSDSEGSQIGSDSEGSQNGSDSDDSLLQQLTGQNYDFIKLTSLISSPQYLRDTVRDLRRLDLGSNRTLNHLKIASGMQFGKLKALETLVLRHTFIQDADCQAYAYAFEHGGMKCLRHIDFSENLISHIGASALAGAILSGHVKSLQEINLGNNEIGDAGMVALGNAFRSDHVEGLSHIDFSGNSISDSGAKALGRAFQYGRVKNLQVIKLKSNEIGDDGMVALGNAFKVGRVEGLSHMDLSENSISTPGAESLASAFQSGHMKNLVEINLGANRIGDDGMVALGNGFGSGYMQKLREVHLENNGIGDRGIVHLAAVLEKGKLPNLHSLNLHNNTIGVTGINGLAKALESGNLNSLGNLNLFHYNPSDKEFESLIQALSNKTLLVVHIVTGSDAVDRQLERQRQVNIQYVKLLSHAENQKAPAKFGKVYLCGNPLVGKTTLRRSLERSKLQSFFMRETRKHEEPRTRGIDVCHITSKGGQKGKKALTLTLWDVAGQHDYHMVHNAFLRDLVSSKANATIFVVMCSSLTQVNMAEKELENWFKFIASSVNPISPNHRDVFVVINRIKGDSTIVAAQISSEWKCLLSVQAKKFEGHLKINKDPFILDVRKRRYAERFKKALLKRSEEILKNVEVPQICDSIQKYLSDWVARREQFPVLPWIEIQRELKKRGEDWPDEILRVAFKYLNEVGALIYVDKEFPHDWLLPKVELVVANPTWLCTEILGNMFTPKGMGIPANQLFRDKVDPITGSILLSDFKSYFRWSKDVETPDNTNHLLSILLWLGVCFPGHKENIIIPALISEGNDERKRVEKLWNFIDSSKDRKGQWVMGFSVEQVVGHTALAPMALWYRFQVHLARVPRFNGNLGDENFVAGQSYITFKVEYMVVFIQVHSKEAEQPSFESIDVLVKPLWNVEADDVHIDTRKQRQVDIAGDIVKLLVDLWDEVCPGVGFKQRAIWPWPISTQRPEVVHDYENNYEITKIKQVLEEGGQGQAIQANVGEDSIMWDQLLSTNDKKHLKNYDSNLVDIPRESVRKNAPSGSFKSLLLELNEDVEEISQRFQDFDQTFFEDRQSTCPKLMYVGKKNSSSFMQIKDFMQDPKTFLKVSVHLHFLCEAFYDEKGHGVHVVREQEGVDVSTLKDWARKLAPWIKYSTIIIVTLAKIGSNFVIPGLGLAIPTFIDWQEALPLSDGIKAVTGYTEEQLDSLILEDIKGKGKSSLLSNANELYGHSRKVMKEILGELKAQEYKEKLGLLKVRLYSADGSLIGVRWICYECLDKYRNAGHNVVELN